jgi:hypothetical protein
MAVDSPLRLMNGHAYLIHRFLSVETDTFGDKTKRQSAIELAACGHDCRSDSEMCAV